MVKKKIPCKTKHYPMVVSGSDGDGFTLNDEGYMFVDKLVLIDSKDGTHWDISINGGELLIEPHGKSEKREYRINKIIS